MVPEDLVSENYFQKDFFLIDTECIKCKDIRIISKYTIFLCEAGREKGRKNNIYIYIYIYI